MCAGFGFELREILALRGTLWRLAVVIRAGLLALCVYERYGGAGGIKCEADGLFGESAGVTLIDCVAGEAWGLNFGGGIAVPGNYGGKVMDDGIAADAGLIIGVYQGDG